MNRILALLTISFVATTPIEPTSVLPDAAPTAPQDKRARAKQPAAKRPVDVFAKWNGKWRGTFVVYDTAGVELHRIAVEQEYRTIDAHTQTVTIRDRMADGKIITGRGTNTAWRGKNGSLVLTCSVVKSNGETSAHTGRIVTGPGGQPQLVWYSRSKDKTETFREWVQLRGKRTTYHIHGLGRYGDTILLMAGDYTRLAK